MLLREVFNKVLPWEWDKKNTDKNMVAYFSMADGSEYNVEFNGAQFLNSWDVEFGRSEDSREAPKANITGTGDQYAVFATVIDIIREFMVQVDPDKITFYAENREPSRVKLYDKMVKMFPTGEYDIEISHDSKVTHYKVTKKGTQDVTK
jgi:hypothetical protein